MRRTAAAALWEFGATFDRLVGNRFFAGREFEALIDRLKEQPPFKDFLETTRFINVAQSASLEDIEKDIRKSPAFGRALLQISARLSNKGEVETTEDEVAVAINRLGFDKTILLLAASRLAPALSSKSPLDVDMLRNHTLSSLLIAYEVGRMLKMPDEMSVAIAGAVHNIGSWLFAIGEPGLYAIALAKADGDGIYRVQVEKEIFGLNHREAGSTFLKRTDQSKALQEVAEHYPAPGGATTPYRALAAAVHLADQLAWIAIVDETAALQNDLVATNNPLWTIFQQNGVTLPMDIPELVDALIRMARTTSWLVGVINHLDK
jgi:HD-like signal output (HDOD) protein